MRAVAALSVLICSVDAWKALSPPHGAKLERSKLERPKLERSRRVSLRATTDDDAAKEQRVTSYESFAESSGVAKSIVSSLTNVVNAIRPGAGEAAPLEAKGPSPASPEALRAACFR